MSVAEPCRGHAKSGKVLPLLFILTRIRSIASRHTVFLVVSLFVRFLASKRCGPAENAKKQSVQILLQLPLIDHLPPVQVLLRHFNTLLGYSNSDKCFTIPPARLRRAAVCNAFLHGLPEVLDSNLLIGNQVRYSSDWSKSFFGPFSCCPSSYNCCSIFRRHKNSPAMPRQRTIRSDCCLANNDIAGSTR